MAMSPFGEDPMNSHPRTQNFDVTVINTPYHLQTAKV
jgi:hypothetical protein